MNICEGILLALSIIAFWVAQYACNRYHDAEQQLKRSDEIEEKLKDQAARCVQEKWILNEENEKLKDTIRQLRRSLAEFKQEEQETPPF